MSENYQAFFHQIASALDRPATQSTSAFVKSMASSNEDESINASDLLCGLVGLLSDLEMRIAQLEVRESHGTSPATTDS